MGSSDRAAFRALMTGMAKLYEREIDRVLLDVYWLALGDWSIDEFSSAAAALMRTSKFMPRPADFHELRKSAEPKASEAWAAVLEHLRGGYRDGSGLTPQIDAAVRSLGGYRHLALMPIDKLGFEAHRFAEAYHETTSRTEAPRLPSSIAGLLS